jgi:hypothetical protein
MAAIAFGDLVTAIAFWQLCGSYHAFDRIRAAILSLAIFLAAIVPQAACSCSMCFLGF